MAVDNLIDAQRYQDIADLYASAVAQISGVSAYYYDAAVVVLQANEFGPELDLLRPFWSAYLSSISAYSAAPSTAIAAVTALNKHVLSNAIDSDTSVNYANISKWLSDNNITVEPEFADISKSAGYPLDFVTYNGTGGTHRICPSCVHGVND